MLVDPLPEVRLSLTNAPGAILQKPRCGTILRFTRSARGMGAIG
jgi:hypothetical protein